jgi:hypothetical protein
MAQNQNVFPVGQAPSKSAGNGPDQAWIDNYNRLRVQQASRLAAVKGGQLWRGGSPTPGTGIASHAAPTATDGTKALAYYKNNYAVGTGKNIYVDRIKFAITVAGTNATSSRIYVEKTAAGTERFTSGGSTNLNATTLVASNLGVAPYATSMVLRLGALVTVADANAKQVADGLVRAIIPKVNDVVVLDFGEIQETSGCTLFDVSNTSPVITRLICDPVELAPGEQLLVHLVNAGQDAASSYSMAVSWREEG